MDEEQESRRKQVEWIISTDDRQEFVSFLRGLYKKNSETGSHILSLSELLKLICLHRAVDCAIELLEGENRSSVDLNVALEDGLSPLHLAARGLCYGLVEIFLRHGAEANLCCDNGVMDPATLPLSVALKTICQEEYVTDWSPSKSIFKLFYIFCLQELKEPLETIKLLASRTEQVEMISFRCVEEGAVVQLSALLLVAWDKLVAPFTGQVVDGSPIGQHILKEFKSVSYQEMILTACSKNCKPFRLVKGKKTRLVCAWRVLKMLEKSRDDIEFCRHILQARGVRRYELPYEVASKLYYGSKPVMKPKDVYPDDIKCLRPKLKPRQKAWLKGALEKQLRSQSISSRGAAVEHSTGTAMSTMLSRMPYTPCRRFHTFRVLDFNGPKLTSPLVVFPTVKKMCDLLFLTAKRSVK